MACTLSKSGRRLTKMSIPRRSVASVRKGEIENATARYISKLVKSVSVNVIFDSSDFAAGISIMSAVSRLPSFCRKRYGHDADKTSEKRFARVTRSYSVVMYIWMYDRMSVTNAFAMKSITMKASRYLGTKGTWIN